YTGFGRTGTMFACERDGIRPDLLCLGKAMAGGFPISATVGTRAAMDAWEPSSGEALHTSTHLGNPMGCAAALAAIGETERLRLPARAESLSAVVEQQLRPLRDCGAVDVRGRGLMWAVEFADGERAGAVVTRALRAGIIVLQSGLRGETVTIAPPLTIAEDQLAHALEKLVLVAGDAR
ncbi:MAG: aminotransferase class III-fold pyridoxal phosphate-dependent enzyme, partial [Candidatus Dormibacteria bacterium]